VDRTIIIDLVLFIELSNNHKGPLLGRLSLILFPNSLVIGKR
jgi:ABC-type tungstate transport system substrate-binding protein